MEEKKMSTKAKIAIGVGALVIVAAMRGKETKVDLTSAAVNGPSAAELAPIFELAGKATDLQRDEKEKEIKGKVVSWTGLSVYEVSKRGEDCFKIQTSSKPSAIGAFITACPADQATRAGIANLKTGDTVAVKAVIEEISLRNAVLNPAIVTLAGAP